jgi:hypothetical protein
MFEKTARPVRPAGRTIQIAPNEQDFISSIVDCVASV